MTINSSTDVRYMRRALALARRGRGWTSPNPCVGAVLVRANQILGEGYHARAGAPHAEVEAIRRAKLDGPRSIRHGLTLYVTLEPCSTHGRTPPCTQAIISAGIGRVVVAARDPNPKHNGRGLGQLRRAGIKVEQGLLADDATQLNSGFNHWIVNGRPLVIAKAAMSLDGKIATRTGDSRWITDTKARRVSHQLRAQYDAVLVGAGTAQHDDPRLTLRHGVRGQQPWRVLVDGQGQVPLSAHLFSDRLRQRTIVATTSHSSPHWRKQLVAAGVTVLNLPVAGGHVSLKTLLRLLGRRQITSLLVEGGGGLLGAFCDKDLVDEVRFFYAPVILGGATATAAVAGAGAKTVAAGMRLVDVSWTSLGHGQVLCSGRVKR